MIFPNREIISSFFHWFLFFIISFVTGSFFIVSFFNGF